jgi:serine/threonine protein kinase
MTVTSADNPTTIADYHLGEPVSDGTDGRMFRATPPARLGLAPGTSVVVKVVPGSNEAAFRRLTRLLQTFAAVRSPYLVTLYDAGQQGEDFFYSMADWPAGTLAAPTAGPLDRTTVLAAVRRAALAAHDLHEAGVAHRSITPSAVLLQVDGAVLGGLDLARAMMGGGSVTSMGTMGSVAYLDPGVIKGDLPSRASDIYSLGATLHHGLSGQALYPDLPSGDPVLAIRTVLRGTPRIDPSLDAADAELVRACTDPDPAARPSTAADLAELLAALEDRS